MVVGWGTEGLEVSAGGGYPEHQSLSPVPSLHRRCYHGNQSLRAGWGLGV